MSRSGRVLRNGLLAALLAATAMVAHAARLPETPRFRVIGVAQGLPSTAIVGVAADRAGYIWVATQDGLARYDGVGFRVWRHVPSDPTALPGNSLQVLHVDAGDRVWVGTENGGLSQLDAARERFRTWNRASHPQIGSDDVWSIASRGDEVWFGTFGGGLHRLSASGAIRRWMPVSDDPRSLPADTVLALAFDAGGVLWIGTTAGLARLEAGGLRRVPLPGGDPAAMVFSLIPEGSGMWVGSASGAYHLERGRWRTPTWSAMFARPNALNHIARDSSGRARAGAAVYWIASQRGLWRTDDDGVPGPVRINGTETAKLTLGLLRRPDGALWVAVPGQGLGYLRPDWQGVAYFSKATHGLAAELYRGLAPARSGGAWIAGQPGVVERLHQGELQPLELTAPARTALQGAKFYSVVEAVDGGLWLGHARGLLRLKAGGVQEWTHDSPRDAALPGQPDLMRIGPDGSLWISFAGGGIQQRDPVDGRVLTELLADADPGLGSADTDAMAFDVQGRLWVAGAQGVAAWSATTRGFERLSAFGAGRVDALAFDGRDGLWLHRLAGLEHYRCTPPCSGVQRWTRVGRAGPADGFPAVDGSGLAVDAARRVWLSSPRGLLRWDPRQRRLRRFGVQDGLSSQEFVPHALLLGADGVLHAATTDGAVVQIDTAAANAPARKPALRLDAVEVRREGAWHRLPTDVPPRLSAQDRELRVAMRLLAFTDPDGNVYRSRLDGIDRGWVHQGASGERVLAGLPVGRYRLRMRAQDASGVLSDERELRFEVMPPWWQTDLARALFVLLGLLALWAGAGAYRRRLQRRHALELAESGRCLAQQASEAKTRFLATLGHEVRTPMTGVLGMSELLLGSGLDPRQRGYAQAIQGAGEHLLRLVNDALDLARIEAGRLTLQDAAFDVRALLAEVVALQAPMAKQGGLRFVVHIDPDTPGVLRGDAARLRQILLNLLGNAIKFTERGSVTLRIGAVAPSGLCIEVADTGPGLSAEQQARLFRRFEQGEAARTTSRYGGSGLGLAICQELTIAMGGRIWVDSAPGVGTRFLVELPLPAASASAPVSAAVTSATASLQLLLVEDDATVAEVLRGLLQAQGHRVVHAAHGLAALTELATGTFDAALLDLDLPGIDGLELARQIRAGDSRRRLPLLAVTARSDAQAEPMARAAGFDGFLRKPVSGAMLGQALNALMAAAKPLA